jgi:hypothetical protein
MRAGSVNWSLWNPSHEEQRRLVTRLTPEECVERLTAIVTLQASDSISDDTLLRLRIALGRTPLFNYTYTPLAQGDVSTEGFTLQLRVRKRNRVLANGEFQQSENGTHIPIRLELDKISVFTVILLEVPILMFFLPVAFFAPLNSHTMSPGIAPLLFVAFLSLAFAIPSAIPGMWKDAGPLLLLLRETLDAEELPASTR